LKIVFLIRRRIVICSPSNPWDECPYENDAMSASSTPPRRTTMLARANMIKFQFTSSQEPPSSHHRQANKRNEPASAFTVAPRSAPSNRKMTLVPLTPTRRMGDGFTHPAPVTTMKSLLGGFSSFLGLASKGTVPSRLRDNLPCALRLFIPHPLYHGMWTWVVHLIHPSLPGVLRNGCRETGAEKLVLRNWC